MTQAEKIICKIFLEDECRDKGCNEYKLIMNLIETQPCIEHCKDCKWWKDSDGVYRRGIGAESQCPINRKEVFEGNGYCYLYKPKMEGESDADID